jgi:hypothetical protein
VPEVRGQEDGGHAAAPELTLEAVATNQACLELFAQVCHGALSG